MCDRIDLPVAGVTVTYGASAGTQNLSKSDVVQRAAANNKILQTGGTINIDQFLLSSTKAAVASGHINYELRGGILYSDYKSTFTWDNNSDRASRFVQTGGSAKFGATGNNKLGLQMAQKSNTQRPRGLLVLGSNPCRGSPCEHVVHRVDDALGRNGPTDDPGLPAQASA